MKEPQRTPKVVELTAGAPRVPPPHPDDYSSPISDATFALIDEQCDQNELSSGKPLQRFEW